MKIGVVGAGSVGVGVCNYLLTLGSVRELVLLNRTRSRAEGEILDFTHTNALTFSKNTKLIATDNYADLKDADIVAITAGAQIKEGQSRLELAEVNSQIGVEIAKRIEGVAPNAILIIVTNPCDVVAHFVAANTGFSLRRIISSGCLVDTTRLMSILAQRVRVDPKNVFGYVLGEHGDNCFTPRNLISIAGQPADYYCDAKKIDRVDPNELLEAAKQAGYEIFRRKQNTTHGVAASVFRIIQAITINEHSVLPVGIALRGEYGLRDVVLSLPCVINETGIDSVLTYPFTEDEMNSLHRISNHLKGIIKDVSEKTNLKSRRCFENSPNSVAPLHPGTFLNGSNVKPTHSFDPLVQARNNHLPMAGSVRSYSQLVRPLSFFQRSQAHVSFSRKKACGNSFLSKSLIHHVSSRNPRNLISSITSLGVMVGLSGAVFHENFYTKTIKHGS